MVSTWVCKSLGAASLVDAARRTLGSAGQVGHGIDQLGDGVSVRRWATGAVLALGLVVLAPTTASAAPPDTPGQSGEQGCRENGQAVAGLAQGGGSNFGQTAAANTPIAPVNATFFGFYC